VGSLCDSCKWCLLLLAGCEGFYGVRISEVLAAYVVLVPFINHLGSDVIFTLQAGMCHTPYLYITLYRI
jgi:hypothetical protein